MRKKEGMSSKCFTHSIMRQLFSAMPGAACKFGANLVQGGNQLVGGE